MKECDYIAVDELRSVKLSKDLLLNLAGRSANPLTLRRALDAVSELQAEYEKKIVIDAE